MQVRARCCEIIRSRQQVNTLVVFRLSGRVLGIPLTKDIDFRDEAVDSN